MYGILRWAGKQYKVEPGKEIVLEKVPGKAGETVELGPLVFFNRDGEVIADVDRLTGAKVAAEIIDQFQGDKVMVQKYKAKKNYRRFQGHRQELTRVMVEDILLPGEKRKKAASKKAAEKTAVEASAPTSGKKASAEVKAKGKAAEKAGGAGKKQAIKAGAVGTAKKKPAKTQEAKVATSGEAAKIKKTGEKKPGKAGKEKGD